MPSSSGATHARVGWIEQLPPESSRQYAQVATRRNLELDFLYGPDGLVIHRVPRRITSTADWLPVSSIPLKHRHRLQSDNCTKTRSRPAPASTLLQREHWSRAGSVRIESPTNCRRRTRVAGASDQQPVRFTATFSCSLTLAKAAIRAAAPNMSSTRAAWLILCTLTAPHFRRRYRPRPDHPTYRAHPSTDPACNWDRLVHEQLSSRYASRRPRRQARTKRIGTT